MRILIRALVVLTSWLAVPTIAQAHRAPTPRERSQIRHAAILAEGGPRLRIAVTDIRVSAAGAWATATVTTYPKAKGAKPEMVAEDTFLKAHGKWLDTNYYAKQPVLKQCHACESRLTRCFTCNRTGQVRDQVTGVMLTCSVCVGRRGFTCSACQGRGYRYEQP